MKVAQKCALGPGIGGGLGLQPRQIRAGERPRLRHKENAAHAALQHRTARLVLAPIGHLPPNRTLSDVSIAWYITIKTPHDPLLNQFSALAVQN